MAVKGLKSHPFLEHGSIVGRWHMFGLCLLLAGHQQISNMSNDLAMLISFFSKPIFFFVSTDSAAGFFLHVRVIHLSKEPAL